MRASRLVQTSIVLQAIVSAQAIAQDPAPLLSIGRVESRSQIGFANASHVVELRDGGVLVLDSAGTRVTLLDPLLASSSEVVRAASLPAHPRGRGLIPWYGDSTLFVDLSSRSIHVLDARGSLHRTINIPNASLGLCLVGADFGTPSLDPTGRILCQSAFTSAPGDASPDVFIPPDVADSSALLRIDVQRWLVDTLAFTKTGAVRMAVAEYEMGSFGLAPMIDPVPVADDWAQLDDGSIAIIRAADYRIEWLRPDGSTGPSFRIPYTPVGLNQSEKAELVDSARSVVERIRSSAPPGALLPSLRDPSLAPVRSSEVRSLQLVLPSMARHLEVLARHRGRQLPPLFVVSADQLPDFLPPFHAGSVRADFEGNLWIRTRTALENGSVYDVVSAQGDVTSVHIPAGRAIVGFGRRSVVYLAVTELDGERLERVRLRR